MRAVVKGYGVRLRLLIPAAVAAAATYAALVRDEGRTATQWIPAEPSRPAGPDPGLGATGPPVAGPRPLAPSPSPSGSRIELLPDTVPAAGASPYADLADPDPLPQRSPSVYDLLAGSPPPPVEGPFGPDETPPPSESSRTARSNDESATVDPDPGWGLPAEEGRFALGGWAASAGHSVVSAVTFRRRLAANPAPDRIELHVEAAENVAEDGPTVMAEPGFVPDRDGFTLMLTAAHAGAFSAAGSYRIRPGEGRAPSN